MCSLGCPPLRQQPCPVTATGGPLTQPRRRGLLSHSHGDREAVQPPDLYTGAQPPAPEPGAVPRHGDRETFCTATKTGPFITRSRGPGDHLSKNRETAPRPLRPFARPRRRGLLSHGHGLPIACPPLSQERCPVTLTGTFYAGPHRPAGWAARL